MKARHRSPKAPGVLGGILVLCVVALLVAIVATLAGVGTH